MEEEDVRRFEKADDVRGDGWEVRGFVGQVLNLKLSVSRDVNEQGREGRAHVIISKGKRADIKVIVDQFRRRYGEIR